MSTFRDLIESVDITDMIEAIVSLEGKGADKAWQYMQDLSHDLGLHAGVSAPYEYLEKMSDKQIKEIYKKIKKYIGKM